MAEPDTQTITNQTAADSGSSPVFRQVSALFGACAAAIGMLGFVGLVFHVTIFRSIFAGYQTMAFSTAAIMVLFGTIIAVHAVWPFREKIRYFVQLAVVAIAVTEAIELPLNILGSHFVIENLMVQIGNGIYGASTSAISPGTLFLVIGSALGIFLLVRSPDPSAGYHRDQDTLSCTGLVVALVSFMFLMSYAYGAPFLYGTPLIPIAAPTALALTFIGAGLIAAAGPWAFPTRYFIGPSTVARLLRTFLPLTLLIILVESFLDVTLPLVSLTHDALQLSISLVLFSLVTGYLVARAAQGLGGALEAEENERKEAEHALATAHKKLNILNSITRHDILNQLTAIRGYLELYHEECQGDKKLEGYFSRLIGISDVIANQISFTKFYQEIGVKAPVWQRVQELARVPAREGGFSGIRFTIEDLPVEVFADPLLEKVFFNLYDNSVRHGEHVTEIGVGAVFSGDNCIIVVEDNGIGVPGMEKERIFERGVGKNTGLGLFLVREILTITGMTIRETGAPGKGARFEIRVPKGTYRLPK